MCGISGYIAATDKSAELDKSLLAIQHRGPDSHGKLTWDQEAVSYVGLGHVRLSILDLTSSGNQPMLSRDGRVAMIFNGEIYNYIELREILAGQQFSGHSDSEVLLECYSRFGLEILLKLRGMFSVAFYELNTKRIVLARDQIGVKPLYYTRSGGDYYFSSEIRGLRAYMTKPPKISREAIFEFLSTGFVYEPNTGFEEIQKIPAGHYAVIENGDLSLHCYFNIEKESRQGVFSEELLKEAIKRQLVSDAKLGVFYSGGIDSTVIAAYARKPNLFANYGNNDVNSSGSVDDKPFATAITKYLNQELRVVPLDTECNDAEAILSSMRAVAVGTEELISDYTYYASAELAKAARAEGFKVMLSGMGGDEVFVGYPRYRLLLGGLHYRILGILVQSGVLRSIIRRVPRFAKKIDRFAEFFNERSFVLRYSRLIGYFSRQELIGLLGEVNYCSRSTAFVERINNFLVGFEEESDLIKALVIDYYGFLSHNLMVADKSSMSVGLELRVPLLDQDLYCNHLGALRCGLEPFAYGKQVLRNLLYKYVPHSLIDRRKSGFNPPLDKKIDVLGRARILDILGSKKLSSFLNPDSMVSIVNRHFSGVENNTYKIWQLIYLSLWLDENIS